MLDSSKEEALLDDICFGWNAWVFSAQKSAGMLQMQPSTISLSRCRMNFKGNNPLKAAEYADSSQ
jgi:hypothetical protein